MVSKRLIGHLTPEQQVEFLTKVWGRNTRGYVFLPYIDGGCTTKDERRKAFHECRAFKWPKERDTAILDHIKAHQNDDLYFPPNVFNGKRRIEQNVEAERVLYADLDPVDPRTLGDLRPTIAWESSPGHYQAIWLLDSSKTGATWAGNENHRLTAAIQADPSGWDSTQLLRIPGKANFKPEYTKNNGGKGVFGEGILWANGPRYTWDQFDDLPAVGSVVHDEVETVDEELINSVDRHEVWSRVRLKVSKKVREYLALKTDPAGTADRDQVLWQIERDLADAGCTLIEIVAIVRDSVWNKYKGRNDEMKRLKIEASKAIHARSDEPLESTPDEEPKPKIQWLNDVLTQHIPRPRWLIKDIWTKGGLGFISGAPKSYKSWMALDMAVTVATGGYWLNQAGYRCDKPQPVLYLQEEDDIRLVKDRLAKIIEAKAPDQFWDGQMHLTGEYTGDSDSPSLDVWWHPPVTPIPIALHVQTGFIASDPGWQAWLDEIIEEGKFALVLIDTLGTVAGEIDTDKSGELMTKMLKPLRVIARKHDAAICVVHHNKKASNQGQRAGQDMLGSTALHAWVECAIYARSKDSNGEIAIEREAKLAMDMGMKVKIPHMYESLHAGPDREGMRVLWDPEVITEGLETMNEPVHDDQPRRKPGTAGSQIATKMRYMGRGPFTIEELMERLGEDKPHNILKQLQAAVKNGHVEEDDGHWTCVS